MQIHASVSGKCTSHNSTLAYNPVNPVTSSNQLQCCDNQSHLQSGSICKREMGVLSGSPKCILGPALTGWCTSAVGCASSVKAEDTGYIRRLGQLSHSDRQLRWKPLSRGRTPRNTKFPVFQAGDRIGEFTWPVYKAILWRHDSFETTN